MKSGWGSDCNPWLVSNMVYTHLSQITNQCYLFGQTGFSDFINKLNYLFIFWGEFDIIEQTESIEIDLKIKIASVSSSWI
jgi:hypothetical protein